MSNDISLPEDTAITIDESGMYRWRGTINLRENPTMALFMAKILAVIIGSLLVVFLAVMLLSGISPERVLPTLAIALGVSAVVAIAGVLGYLVYAALIGWTYSADYCMDETGLMFRPAPREDKVAKDVALGTAIVSAVSGNFGVTVASIASMNNEAASVFSSVRKVKGIRKHRCIKISEIMLYNQVYVAPQDYDFVYGFISSHCPKAKSIEA